MHCPGCGVPASPEEGEEGIHLFGCGYSGRWEPHEHRSGEYLVKSYFTKYSQHKRRNRTRLPDTQNVVHEALLKFGEKFGYEGIEEKTDDLIQFLQEELWLHQPREIPSPWP